MTHEPTPSAEALLPCPLCRGEAEYAPNPLLGDNSMARCKSCGCEAHWRKWNTRATLPPQHSSGDARELIDQLRELPVGHPFDDGTQQTLADALADGLNINPHDDAAATTYEALAAIEAALSQDRPEGLRDDDLGKRVWLADQWPKTRPTPSELARRRTLLCQDQLTEEERDELDELNERVRVIQELISRDEGYGRLVERVRQLGAALGSQDRSGEAALHAELTALKGRIDDLGRSQDRSAPAGYVLVPREAFQEVRAAIASLDEDALGYGPGDSEAGIAPWPLRDELLYNIDRLLAAAPSAPSSDVDEGEQWLADAGSDVVAVDGEKK